MEWFGRSSKPYHFEMFSESHFVILAIFLLISAGIFFTRKKLMEKRWRKVELGIAASLVLFEITYHVWMYMNGLWKVSRSLPLELCNISLFLCVLLLLTKKTLIYEILFFTAILGASQAIFTPALTYDFPHFRFFHFFYAHAMIVWVTLFFTWVKGYHPKFQSVLKVIIFINLFMPIILIVNQRTNGNYWFLRHKPEGPSFLDMLGPYPWYIFSLEGLLVILSLIVWLIFRKWEKNHVYSYPISSDKKKNL